MSHKKKYNHGQEEFVILRDHHEPIISRELFERAQKELERRSPSPEQRAKHSNRYCLSGKIVCGHCGARFISRSKKRKDGSMYKAWRCYEATQHGLPKQDAMGNQIGCIVNQQIRDEDFMLMLEHVIRHLHLNRAKLIAELTDIIKTVLKADSVNKNDIEKLKKKIEILSEKKERLMELYIEKEITKEEYRKMVGKYEAEKQSIAKQIENAEKQNDLANRQEEMLKDMVSTIQNMVLGEQPDDIFYRSIVDRIVVYGRHNIEIYLNLLPFKWAYALAELPKKPTIKKPPDAELFEHDIGTYYLSPYIA